jgi:putative MATE family efflux protein
MISQLIGAVFNIIFDPILIFGLFGFPKMGVKGAAIATISGQILGLSIAVCLNLFKNKEINFRFRNLKPDIKIIRDIYRVGAPAIVNQSFNSLLAFGVNLIIIKISSTAVAAFGIYIKVQNFILLPVFGLNNGVIAITAFNYGARNKKRIDASIKYGMLYAACIMFIGTVFVQVFARPMVSLFDASDELTSICVRAMRIISLTYVVAAFTLIAQGVYQALGNGIYSLFITLTRVVIVLLPVLYIFSKLFPIDQIWWAFSLAEGGSALVGVFLLKRIYSQRVAKLNHGSNIIE